MSSPQAFSELSDQALSALSDQEVVALALKRQRGAWAELVNRYEQRVRRLISRHVKTEEHVEQLAQDTFFKAALFLQNYRPENSFKAWMWAITYHTAIDYARARPLESESLPHRVSLDALDARGIGEPHPAEITSAPPGTPELRQELEDALQQLSPVQREVVEMHVIERLSYGDIAETLRLPEGTVKSHFNRAIKKLRTLLGHVLDSSDPNLTPLEDDPVP